MLLFFIYEINFKDLIYLFYAGLDIGGTKSAVVLGSVTPKGTIDILSREKFDTIQNAPYEMLNLLKNSIYSQIKKYNYSPSDLAGIGISCGGPLNSKTGTILSPPNLPSWDNIPISNFFKKEFNIDTFLQNDANACAVAEWRFGAGVGCKNMIFLTFGTGFGAGLILNGRLYTGFNDLAGEIGHIRIAPDGPNSYGKAGSSEGYCSGNGIAKLGVAMAEKELKKGNTCTLLKRAGSLSNIDTKLISQLAHENDELCLEIFRISGEKLGQILSLLIDTFNPDAIVIGSIFVRCYNFLWPSCSKIVNEECLPASLAHCKILKSSLNESVGDVAALTIATGKF